MMFSGHVAATAISLRYLSDPTAVIAANLVAHPILDAVPHLDWATVWGRRHGKALGVALTGIDLVAGGWLVGLMLERFGALSSGLILGAIAAGMWMDLLDPLFRRWRFLAPFRRLHLFCHACPNQAAHDYEVDWPRTITGRTPDWIKLALLFGLVAVTVAVLL